MPVPTKLDPVALPEKGRYVEGPLLYTPHSVEGLTEKMLGSSSRPFGKITGVSSNNARSDAVVCPLPEWTHESILESWKPYKRAWESVIDTPQKQQSSAQGTRQYLLP